MSDVPLSPNFANSSFAEKCFYLFVDRPNSFFLSFFLLFISPLSSSVRVARRHTRIENNSNVMRALWCQNRKENDSKQEYIILICFMINKAFPSLVPLHWYRLSLLVRIARNIKDRKEFWKWRKTLESLVPAVKSANGTNSFVIRVGSLVGLILFCPPSS